MYAKNVFIIAILMLLSYLVPAYAVAPSVKSQEDYIYLLGLLRNTQVMISNFANDDQKKKYNEINTEFRNASVDFYAHNFVYYDKESDKHRVRFYGVKSKLVTLLEEMAKVYIDRSENLLRSTSKDSFDILIKFTKGGYAKYFTRPVNPISPIKNEKIYKTEEYHLYIDKEVLEEYLRRGYKILQDAKRNFTDPDLAILKEKKEKNNQDLNFMINKYFAVISQCRSAKLLGIEIYRTIYVYNLTSIRKKLEQYEISPSNPEPIFDVRIPEPFKVDANDNLQLIHEHEIKKVPNDFPKSPISLSTTENAQPTPQQQPKN